MITKNLSTLKIHKLTREQYERELNAGNIDTDAIYLTPDDEASDLSHLATKAELVNYAQKTDLESLETISAAQAKLAEAKAYADGKAPMVHNHDSAYDAKGAANTALENAKAYVGEAIKNFITSSAVDSKISSHNVSGSAHNDIRTLITTLTNRFNALANSDDETLDQLSEIVAYIKSNKSLIDTITTNKVNVADIINNLTTNVSNKPLSAAQGVALKGLIDALTQVVNGKADAQHTHNYLPLSGGTLTGDLTVPNINVTGTTSKMASHYYHKLYGDNNVYVHYYDTTDFSKTTTATFRVSDATNKTYKALQFSGDGNFKWNNSQVLTEHNYGSYIRTLPYLATTQAFSPAAGKDANLTAGTSRLYANALVISNPTTANDVGWVRVTGTGESDTVLELATGDDGGGSTCEAIVARQYNTFNGVDRQAVLLASDGTSSFPVSVSAPVFIGNATSASHTPMINCAYGAETQMTQTAGEANIRFYFNVSKGKAGQFATGNNANTLICINRHSGNYESQLAFSDNGELYYRSFSGTAPDTTTAWKTLLTSANYVAHDKFNSIGTENYIAFPGGGSFIANQNTQTGYMKITLPVSWTSTMIRFKVQIYNYSTDTSCEYVIAGYNYSNDSKWYNCSAYATGKFTSHSNLDVSFGHDGSKCAITIGSANTSWSYAQIRITDVLVGYSNYNFNTWKTGWNVSFTTTSVSPSATVKATHVAATAGNADFLDGYHGSTSAVKNTYVLRTNDNYIYTNYINSNTSNNENPSISQVIVTNGSDHFYRKASLAHFRRSLGLTFDIKEAYISSGFNTSFRTTLKGSSSNGTFLSVLRSNSTISGYITAYASGFAWGKDDTQGFISVGYNDQVAYIGGGNADKLNWVKQISFTDHTHSYLPLSGGTMGANAAIKFPASAGAISINDPMSITYGRIASYGTLCINGDTDGSTNESVIITAGRGHSSSASDGLSVGYSSLTWQGNSVVTVAGATMAGKITGSTTQGSWISCTRNGAFRLETAATGGSASSVLSMKTSSGAWSITNLTGSNSLFFCFGTDTNYSNGNNTTTNIEFSGGTIIASLSGNASTASKWATARTLTLTGAVTGSASIDGSGNVSLATSANHNHDGAYVNVTGDAMSGRLTLNTSIYTHSSPMEQCLVINSSTTPSGTTLGLANAPGIGFHIANVNWGSLVFDGSFNFINSSFNGYMPVKCSSLTASGTITGTTCSIGSGGLACSGNMSVSGSIASNTWYSSSYGGGWYMSDTTWIRSYGGKNIYHDSGIMRTDGTLQVGSSGAYFNANSSLVTTGVPLYVNSANSVDMSNNSAAFVIGTKAGQHMEFDDNRIQCKQDTATGRVLHLQPFANGVSFNYTLGGSQGGYMLLRAEEGTGYIASNSNLTLKASYFSDTLPGSITFRSAGYWKSASSIRKGHIFFQDAQSKTWMYLAFDTTSPYISSDAIGGRATSSGKAVYITSGNVLAKYTSASKYKLDIEPIKDETYAYNVLKLNPKTWYDKAEMEAYSRALTREMKGEDPNEVCAGFNNVSLERIPGLIAEDVEAAGLDKYCIYEINAANNTKEIDGLSYEKIGTLLIPIVRDLVLYTQKTAKYIHVDEMSEDDRDEIANLLTRINSFKESEIIK